MAYTCFNYKSKKALKDAVAAGKPVSCYQPGPFGDGIIQDGTVYLEGPHYPEPHRWYAQAEVKAGVVTKVK